jgi:hypothetical protein
MPKRAQRAGVLPTGVSGVTARTSGRVPGNLDVVQQPGHEMEENQGAGQAGQAVASQWGGAPDAGSPQVGRRQP